MKPKTKNTEYLVIKEKSNVLIVDDLPENLMAAEKVIKNLDVNIFKVESGFEALSILMDKNFAVVLLDVQMPDMDGFETATLIRGNNNTKNTPIIFMTAFNKDDKFVFEGYESGAVDYLFKPLDPVIVRHKVQIFVELDQQRKALEILLDKRKKSEAKVIHQNKLILDTVGEGILGLNSDGDIIFINPMASTMLGHDVIENSNGNIYQIIPANNPKFDTPSAFLEAIKFGKPLYDQEDQFWNKDGKQYPIEFTCNPISTDDSSNGMVVVFKDISERKAIEKAIIKNKEEAEKANNAKSDFLARMSHELRTPLNAIIGFSQYLQRNKDNPLLADQLADVKTIQSAGNHLLFLINEILELSVIESGKMVISQETVSVSQVMKETMDLIRPMSEEMNVEIRDDISKGERHYVISDKFRLKQVLLNLISNAVKYNRDDGKVSVFCEEMPDGFLRINIMDNGLGIDDSQKEHMFDAFTRVHSTEKNVDGAGIGLTIAQKIIRAMKGKLDLHSTPGQGSCFYIELPSCESPDQEIIESDKKLETSDHLISLEDNESIFTVLHIEDDPLNVMLIKKLFSANPCLKYFSTQQGKMGMELARLHKPDIILMDMDLPEENGVDLCYKLKKDKRTKQIPVAALSALGMPSEINAAKKAGVNEYMVKPIDLDVLTTIFNKYMKAKKAK